MQYSKCVDPYNMLNSAMGLFGIQTRVTDLSPTLSHIGGNTNRDEKTFFVSMEVFAMKEKTHGAP